MTSQSAMPRKIIMVIDDSADLLRLYEKVLKSEGYDVVSSPSGDQALVLLGANTPPPHLIFLDFQMKGMNGIEFLLALEERFPAILRDVPVVLLSGADHLPPSKASGMLRKPIDIDRFLEGVEFYLAKSPLS